MTRVRTLAGGRHSSGCSETICKHIADLPLVDLNQVLNHYDSLVSVIERTNADISRMQTQLREDHNAMVKLQRCGAFKGYETLEQRYQRRCSHIPLSPDDFRYSRNKEEIKGAIILEVFSSYGARAHKIVDELLSLKTDEIIAFLKDWNLLNALMKKINEQINLQSQELLVELIKAKE